MAIEDYPPASSTSKTLKLWMPDTIGVITFFLGFPGGIALAAINWVKMGKFSKAIIHILIGVAGIAAVIFLPDNYGRIVGLGLTWGFVAFLRRQPEF